MLDFHVLTTCGLRPTQVAPAAHYARPITAGEAPPPIIRDLLVDRSRLFNDLQRAKCRMPIDGTYDLGPGPAVSKELQEEWYVLSRCTCCLEACPDAQNPSTQSHSVRFLGIRAEQLEAVARENAAAGVHFFGGHQDQSYDAQKSPDLMKVAQKV